MSGKKMFRCSSCHHLFESEGIPEDCKCESCLGDKGFVYDPNFHDRDTITSHFVDFMNLSMLFPEWASKCLWDYYKKLIATGYWAAGFIDTMIKWARCQSMFSDLKDLNSLDPIADFKLEMSKTPRDITLIKQGRKKRTPRRYFADVSFGNYQR